jgi:hypothetical protein
MKREFLESLRVGEESLPEDIMDAILEKHTQALKQVQLQSALETAVVKAGGRNIKAISALLDMEAIGQSQDVPAALQQAVSALKKENAYLFESAAPPPYARFTGTQQQTDNEPQTLAGALRERMKKN